MLHELLVFNNKTDLLVIDALKNDKNSFNDLLTSLPGIYPSIVLDSIKRLTENGSLPPSFNLLLSSNIERHSRFTKLKSYVPHPLDFDWRFNYQTKKELISYLDTLTDKKDTIVLLGTPSLIENKFNFQKRTILLDQNIHTQNFYPNDSSFVCDLLNDKLPKIEADAILADPPWYPEHMYGFVWAASEMAKIGSYFLLCLPPEGTRPSITDEITDLLDYAKLLGFELLRMKKGKLLYDTPLFEKNALESDGINDVTREWRKGDLALFRRNKKKSSKRPTTFSKKDWVEVKINDIRIRIRSSQNNDYQDPRLISVLPNDILPSVSRSDNRRKLADIWTGGNRIFSCKGPNILIQILAAQSQNTSPINRISQFLDRKLTSLEFSQIRHTENQLKDLLLCEQKEIELYYFN